VKLPKVVVGVLALGWICVPFAFSQNRLSPEEIGAPKGNIVVRVRSGGSPLQVTAVVKLFSETRAIEFTSPTRDMGEARFSLVPLGNYRMEIRAPGYVLYSEEVSVFLENTTTTLHAELRPEAVAGAAPPAGPPVLSPKVVKELNQAVEALRVNNLTKAIGHLQQVIKMAPSHPDAYYLMGVILIRQKDLASAREKLEKAVHVFPDHVQALTSLGGLHYEQGRHADAVTVLERAIQLKPDAWQAHEYLAAVSFVAMNFAKARLHAERARELNPGDSPELHYILGVSLWELGQKWRALEELRQFMEKAPEHPGATRARNIFAAGDSAVAIGTENPANPAAAPASALPTAAAPEKPMLTTQPPLPVPARWPLVPVDETTLGFQAGVACSLPSVLAGVSKRVQMLAKNLEQITATESIETVETDVLGNQRLSSPKRYLYVVSIYEIRPGTLSVDEYRKSVYGQEAKHSGIETRGLFALPLLFHPYYSKDFEFRCEGLTQLQGQPAWSLYFQQKKDRPSRIRAYSLRNGRFPVKLKGRVWVAKDSLEILRMEANLLETIKEIELQHEHLLINYRPVEFTSRAAKLWLPFTAEYFAHFRGRNYHFRHSMTDYLVFNVNVGEKQKPAKTEPDKDLNNP
jgi:tetratricopeptide (TPR) repeat protein